MSATEYRLDGVPIPVFRYWVDTAIETRERVMIIRAVRTKERVDCDIAVVAVSG